MEKNFVLSKLADAIDQSKGDDGRNQYLIERLRHNKEIINSDKLYLEKILDLKISNVEYNQVQMKQTVPQKDKTVFLNPKMIKCYSCENEINLDEKSSRYQNNWYHELCVKPIVEKNKPKIIETENIKKTKPDAVQIGLTVAIVGFLITSVFFILGPLSMIAMGIGGVITLYHLVGATGKLYSKNQTGKRAPSVFMVFLLGSPFIIGGIIAFEGYTLLESPVRIILLWALTISFWSTMLFVPMAVVSKYREDKQKDVVTFPKISVIIPAYNEEKVVANTIEGLLETKYPNKEIIFVDDGSTDSTLAIASRYKEKIRVLHKENGGKSTALNYGIVYAKGDIVVIVDADTIIGRNSLKEIVKGFEIDEHVAAVAGNIKVRNRMNIITKCQFKEEHLIYLVQLP